MNRINSQLSNKQRNDILLNNKDQFNSLIIDNSLSLEHTYKNIDKYIQMIIEKI